jgi:hypothetical protein
VQHRQLSNQDKAAAAVGIRWVRGADTKYLTLPGVLSAGNTQRRVAVSPRGGIFSGPAVAPDPLNKMTGVTMSFARNGEIYGQNEPADHIYKIVSGAVRTYKIFSPVMSLACKWAWRTHSPPKR